MLPNCDYTNVGSYIKFDYPQQYNTLNESYFRFLAPLLYIHFVDLFFHDTNGLVKPVKRAHNQFSPLLLAVTHAQAV
jgi:hypothetical protein